ncbi:MAG TPA: hypothetical protein VGM33_14815 [Baekduia sp.]|jgi:hypothetical protein
MSAAWRSSTVLIGAGLLLATAGAGTVWAQDGTSDSGGQEAGESASAWDVGGFLFWMVILFGIIAILALVLVLATRGDDASDAFTGAPEPEALPAARPADDLQAPED